MSKEPLDTSHELAAGDTAQGHNGGQSVLKDRLWEMTTKAKDTANHMAESVSETLGQARESAAGGLNRAAYTTHNIADGMDSTASYLRKNDFNQMGKDILNICRRHPAQSLVAAIAIGFLIGSARR